MTEVQTCCRKYGNLQEFNIHISVLTFVVTDLVKYEIKLKSAFSISNRNFLHILKLAIYHKTDISLIELFS